jgi:enoyl-CoA hydratase/carnithine racemase
MAFQEILYAVEDGIATITLNRPDKLNAFTETMRREMIEAFDKTDDDDDVRVVIVTGAGRGFCAGADLSRGGDTFDVEKRQTITGGAKAAGQHWRDGGGTLTLRIFESRKPVIAAVNGPAVGVGVTMQLPMDIRLASTEARFGFVFARRGLVPEACSSWFLPRVVGISRAMEWVATGRVFPASEALEAGLVRDVVPPDQLMPRAKALAREIADNTSAVSVAVSRQMLWRMLGADHPMEAHKIDSRGIAQLGKMADAREGVTAFLEKRKAKFPLSAARDLPPFFPWWPERPFE